nr:MAG TPA_asm: hypothetical protein [Caudoviricetes sp.]
MFRRCTPSHIETNIHPSHTNCKEIIITPLICRQLKFYTFIYKKGNRKAISNKLIYLFLV